MSPARRRTGPAAAPSLKPPLTPMLAATVEAVPEGPGLAYEPKWDGWRALAFRDADTVQLQSRSGRDLTAYFPDITEAIRAAIPPGAVLDGELVVWQGGRTKFALLQRRVTAGRQLARVARANPANYVLFDLLSAPPGRSLLDVPLAERRALLTELLTDAPTQLTLSPLSTDVAQATEWLTTWTAAGIEGVVIKQLNSRYEPARRGWQKFRARETTEAVIAGVTGTLEDPDTLLIGRLDGEGRLRYAGRTHPLKPVQRRELAPLLAPSRGAPDHPEHPWPQPLPAAWSGQLDSPEPLPYVQVEPTLVAEIEVDTAYEHHRWRHRVRYRRPRTDLHPTDLPPMTAEDGDRPPEPV